MQLMEVVHGVHDNGWLVKLLRGMIFGPGSSEKQKKVREPSSAKEVQRDSAWIMNRFGERRFDGCTIPVMYILTVWLKSTPSSPLKAE